MVSAEFTLPQAAYHRHAPVRGHAMLPVQEIGSQVRHLRRERGLTQADIAALAGVGRRFVSELENGKPTLRLAETNQVLRVFGLALATRPLEAQERE